MLKMYFVCSDKRMSCCRYMGEGGRNIRQAPPHHSPALWLPHTHTTYYTLIKQTSTAEPLEAHCFQQLYYKTQQISRRRTFLPNGFTVVQLFTDLNYTKVVVIWMVSLASHFMDFNRVTFSKILEFYVMSKWVRMVLSSLGHHDMTPDMTPLDMFCGVMWSSKQPCVRMCVGLQMKPTSNCS